MNHVRLKEEEDYSESDGIKDQDRVEVEMVERSNQDGSEVESSGSGLRPNPKISRPLAFVLWTKYSNLYYGWVIICSIGLLWFTLAPSASFGIGFFVGRYLRDTGESLSLVSTYWTISLIIASITSPMVGKVLDKYGSRALYGLFFPINAVGLFLLPLITTPHMLLPLFILLRITQMALVLSIFTTVGQWFVKSRGKASAIANFVGGLTFVTPSVLAVLERITSWKNVVQMESVFVAIGGFIVWFFSIRSPEAVGINPDGAVAKEETSDSESNGNEEEADWTLKEAMKTRVFWVVTAASATIGLFYSGFNFHYDQLLADQGLASDAGSIAFLSLSVGCSFANIFGAFTFDKIKSKPRTCAFATGCGACAAVLLIMASSNFWVIVFGLFYGSMDAFFFLTQSTLFSSLFGRKHVGSIVSVTNSAYTVSLGTGPIMFAVSKDFFGSFKWPLFILMVLLAIETVFLLTPMVPKKRTK